jgi:DNA-directed RNA polymerase specialized sigma subunit
VAYGIFGLIDVIEKYDLERGVKFEVYAISRIKGAIIEELRAKMQDARRLRGPRAPAEAPAGDPGGCPQSRQRPPPAGAAG